MRSLAASFLGVYLLAVFAESRVLLEATTPADEAVSLVGNTTAHITDTTVITEANDCSCDLRYQQHYVVKGCTPVYNDGCDCPVKYDCPAAFLENDTVCYHSGQVYGYREKIPSSNPCQICSCEKNPFDGLDISCIAVECPSAFRPIILDEGCYQVYDKDRCCPVATKCDNETTADERTCELEGKIYHLGQQMHTSEDECLTCLCDENWSGIQDCRKLDCMFERSRRNLKHGCIPVYHESVCCPIEFYCATGEEEVVPSQLTLSNQNTSSTDQCTFGDKHGSYGDVLKISQSNNCITCACTTPPDFTCISKRCPGPPNDDYDNCKSTYTPGECCATYNCIQSAPPPLQCDPVYCEEGCSEVYVPHGCPMCMCHDVLCSPPKCLDSCVIDYDSKPCPSCKCPRALDLTKPMCSPVKCPLQCREAMGSYGCPMCVCGPLCSPPKCQDGCHVQTEFLDGECPGCICANESSPDSLPQILCSPVRCPSYCSEVMGDHGCPACRCDPMCSPPKCEPGCRAEVVPSAGPCPGCVCEKNAPLQCAPVKCAPECTEYTPPNSCPLCQCAKILCSMPKCPQDCEIEYNVEPGSCPYCKCPDTIPLDVPQCGPVKCGPMCYEGVSPQGCPMCVCGPLCSPPKCDDGCKLQTDVPEGECPGCDCPSDANAPEVPNIQCGVVNCPSYCSQGVNEYGCPTCMCEPLCSPPKCDPGCHMEVTPSQGSCPGCVCTTVKPMCGPVMCGPECYETLSPQGCPICVCRPLCSPPRCDLGCHIQWDVPENECPRCECPTVLHAEPKSEDCPPFCRTEVEADGTTSCDCPRPICDPPRCGPGCRIEKVPSSGPCPGCVCGSDGAPDDAFKFCPPLDCDSTCQEVTIDDRCPSCKCDDKCVPPQCPETCHVEDDSDVPEGACPQCNCPINRNIDLKCVDTPCHPPCREVQMSPTTCPMCTCGKVLGTIMKNPVMESPVMKSPIMKNPIFSG